MAASAGTIRVEGLRQLLRATDQAGKETKKLVRDELRKAAEPVRAEAARLFAPVDGRSAARYGISVRKVGTVSVEQRLRKSPNVSARRRNFGPMQMRRALEPALESKSDDVVRALDDALGRLAGDWGHGG